jgi:hypothetical protein
MKNLLVTLFAVFLLVLSTYAQKGTGQKNPSRGQKKANHGQYIESSSLPMHPYTIFYKSKPEYFDLIKSTKDMSELKTKMVEIIQNEIENIQNNVQSTNEYYTEFYDNVYNSGVSVFNSNDSKDIGGHPNSGVSQSSKKCKNAAFVYLMGFDKDGETQNFRGESDHSDFKSLAIIRLQYMNVEVRSTVGSLQWRTKEFIHYLQAYDMLKAAEILADAGVTPLYL